MPELLKKDQIYLQLKQNILRGTYASGMRLPKELEFSRELNVAKVTLRSALARLEAEGLVERLPSKGTFVSGNAAANTILVVITKHSDIHMPYHYIVPGITAAATEAGYKIELCFKEYIRDLGADKAVEFLEKKNLFGILVIDSTYHGTEAEIGIFHRLKLPVMLVHPRKNDHLTTGFSAVATNTRQAWHDGLKHLADSGYHNVRILEAKEESRDWKSDEYPALFEGLGLNTHGRLAYFHESTAHEMDSVAIKATLERLLADNPKVEAIICYSDFDAIEVMKALVARHYRIPEDIAVMGYCGYPGDMMLDPPLSTVDLNFMNIGRMAVRLLPQSPEGKVVQHFSPYQVIARQSTEKLPLLQSVVAD